MDIKDEELIKYRLIRAKETYNDAKILAEMNRWNSSINRLYYGTFYAVSALLISKGIKTSTHTGAKSAFTKNFIKSGIIPEEYGRIYSQLFTWRQKGDYDDFFDFDKKKVVPYLEPVNDLLMIIEKICNSTK